MFSSESCFYRLHIIGQGLCKMYFNHYFQHWYSVLGIHLAKHSDEKRIRSHLDNLLGTPDTLMMTDDEEPAKDIAKETILVSEYDTNHSMFLLLKSITFSNLFPGSREA